jgi:hypothetical protein
MSQSFTKRARVHVYSGKPENKQPIVFFEGDEGCDAILITHQDPYVRATVAESLATVVGGTFASFANVALVDCVEESGDGFGRLVAAIEMLPEVAP